MEKNTPQMVHNLVPILQAGAAIAGILTGAYGLATNKVGQKYPVLIKVGMGAAIVGLGFLLYKEVLRQTKPEGDK
jgi:hypothetical protein